MTIPRSILPGSTHMVQRRTTQRQFFLRPSRDVNQIFGYILALAAKEYGVTVNAACVLSTHFHLIITDPHARMPRFMWRLDQLTARCFNAYYDHTENFWAGGGQSYNPVLLVDSDAVLEEMVYVYANPVAAGLVRYGFEWPGLRSRPEELGEEDWIFERPFFFSSEGLPEMISLRLSIPPLLGDMELGEVQDLLRSKVRECESDHRKRMDASRRRFLGPEKARAIDPHDRPTTPARRGERIPRIACHDRLLRAQILERLATFYSDYRNSLERFCSGEREVIFPAGTYWMRVHFNVRCEEPP